MHGDISEAPFLDERFFRFNYLPWEKSFLALLALVAVIFVNFTSLGCGVR